MSMRRSAGRVRATYEFIKAQRATFSVQMHCRVLDVVGRTALLRGPERTDARQVHDEHRHARRDHHRNGEGLGLHLPPDRAAAGG